MSSYYKQNTSGMRREKLLAEECQQSEENRKIAPETGDQGGVSPTRITAPDIRNFCVRPGHRNHLVKEQLRRSDGRFNSLKLVDSNATEHRCSTQYGRSGIGRTTS